MRGDILITEGINAGASYSVLQLMVKGGDVAWAGGATRVAKNLGVAGARRRAGDHRRRQRRDRRAAQPGDRHPGERRPARPDPAARVGDGQPGRRRDAGEVPGRRRGVHQLRRPARDLVCSPPSAGEAPCEITWGEMFAVLPFGNRTMILTLTGAQLRAGVPQRLLAGLQPGHHHRPVPAGLGPAGDLPLHRHDAGRRRHVEDAGRPGGPETPIGRRRHGPPRHQRLHVHRRRRLHGLRRRAPTSRSPATT